MLNFDNNHSYADGNIDEIKGKKKFKNFIIAGLVFSNLVTFSGCAKNVPCDISDSHAHYYVNDDYLGRYIVSEKSSLSGLNRTDNYVEVRQEDAELLEFINKNDLFRISDNENAIENITNSHVDYIEYRYEYHYLIQQPIVVNNGKSIYTIPHSIPMTGYSWTTDTTKDLTGEERMCHYVYYGYKVVKNRNGVYEIIKSEPVNDLSELPEGYDYIKEKFYDIVNLYDKNKVLDYEDGPEEGKVIINNDEYNMEQGKSK